MKKQHNFLYPVEIRSLRWYFWILLFSLGCHSTRQVESPNSDSQNLPVLPQTLPALPVTPPVRELLPATSTQSKVISDGLEEYSGLSLIEASHRAKALKEKSDTAKSSIIINDENLKEFSSGGQVFLLESEADKMAELMETKKATGDSAESLTFWSNQIGKTWSLLNSLIFDLRRLQLENALLRQQFYAETDPFVRESEIKPRWDRTIDQIERLRQRCRENYDAIEDLLSEARKKSINDDGFVYEDFVLSQDDLQLIGKSEF